MQTGAAPLQDRMEVLQKNKNRITIRSGTTGYLPKDYKNTNSKGYMPPFVYCSIIYNSHVMEATQVPIDRQMDKEEVVYMYNGILFSHKKEWNLAICNNMDGLYGMMLSEISQKEKDK